MSNNKKEHHAEISKKSYEKNKVAIAIRRKELREAKKQGITLLPLRRNLPINDDENEAVNALLNLSLNSKQTPQQTQQTPQQIQQTPQTPQTTTTTPDGLTGRVLRRGDISKGAEVKKKVGQNINFDYIMGKLEEEDKKSNKDTESLDKYRRDLNDVFHHLHVQKDANIYIDLLNFNRVKDSIENAKQRRNPEKGYAYTTICGYAQVIARLIRLVCLPLGFPEETYKLYDDWYKERNELVAADRGLKHIREKKTVLSFTDYLEKIKNKFGESSKEFFVASLYSEITARDDYPNMSIVQNEGSTNKKNNFIIVPENQNEPVIIEINKYKTESSGQFKEKLSTSLSKLVRDYIRSTNLTYGNAIFGKTSFSKIVGDINKGIGEKGGINLVRQQRATTDVLDPNATPESVRESAKKSFHSVATHLKYVKELRK